MATGIELTPAETAYCIPSRITITPAFNLLASLLAYLLTQEASLPTRGICLVQSRVLLVTILYCLVLCCFSSHPWGCWMLDIGVLHQGTMRDGYVSPLPLPFLHLPFHLFSPASQLPLANIEPFSSISPLPSSFPRLSRHGMEAMPPLWTSSSSFNPTLLAILMAISAFLGFLALIFWLTKRHRSRADHSPNMSPDTVSSLFPDRPIRPLPKRRLRERLSPDVADAIKYPPSTQHSVPLFHYPPYTLKDESGHTRIESISPTDQPRRIEPPRNYTPRRNGVAVGSGEEPDSPLRTTLVTRASPEILNRAVNRPPRPEHPRSVIPQPPPSAASSVDGYDSFENTNNKKKRKIPSAGDSALFNPNGLSTDMNSHTVSNQASSPVSEWNGDRYGNVGGYSAPGSFSSNSQGISGSGRGRLGRSRNGRSPLGTLSDGNNAWAGRSSKAGGPQWASLGMCICLVYLPGFTLNCPFRNRI